MQQLEHRKSGISKGLLCGMYLLSFSLMMFLLLSPFVRSGRSLVIDDDGIKQHIKALDFYGRYLRMLLSRIAEGHLHLPAYSLALGYGADVITTLHYYVIGDPLNVSAVFFDTAHIVYLYNALIVVRMGLSGLPGRPGESGRKRGSHFRRRNDSRRDALCLLGFFSVHSSPPSFFHQPDDLVSADSVGRRENLS